MNEQDAYGDRTYTQRIMTRYNVGDIVQVGPAYRMGGSYEHDGWEGVYTVLGVLPPSPKAPYASIDYYVARGEIADPQKEDWEGIVHPSRLSLVRLK